MIWFVFLVIALVYYFKGHPLAALVILFFFLTSGFQFVPLSLFDTGFGITKALDFAVIFIVWTFLVDVRTNIKMIREDPFAKTIIVFISFVLIAVLYSLIFYGYDLAYVIRSSRRFLILLIYFDFRKLNGFQLQSLVNFLLAVTFLQGAVYLLQIPTGTVLMNSGLVEGASSLLISGGAWWSRYYNFPLFVVLFFFYVLLAKEVSPPKRFLFVFTFGVVILATFHRSWIFAVLVGILCVGLLTKARRAIVWLAVLYFAIIQLPGSSSLSDRLLSGISDFNHAITGGYELTYLPDTFSFRIAHFIERAEYVASSPQRILFGLGFLTEDSPYTRQLPFIVGYADESGVVTQVDTSDIAWSLLVVFVGVLGTLLYIWLYAKGLVIAWNNRGLPIGQAALGFMVAMFFTSFTSTYFVDIPTFVGVPLFIAFIAAKSQSSLIPANTRGRIS